MSFLNDQSTSSISRRDLLKLAGASALGWSLLDSTISGRATAAQKSQQLEPLNRFPRMVQEYFVSRVRAAEKGVLAAQDLLQTKADAETYVKGVQARARDSFGPFPERTPLNARITGVIERETYKIEKLIFESRPGFLVTANIYIPLGRQFPLPAVVGTCGHSNNGKAEAAYQSFAQGLAKQGYVCLIYDPISQGERLQCPNAKYRDGVLALQLARKTNHLETLAAALAETDAFADAVKTQQLAIEQIDRQQASSDPKILKQRNEHKREMKAVSLDSG